MTARRAHRLAAASLLAAAAAVAPAAQASADPVTGGVVVVRLLNAITTSPDATITVDQTRRVLHPDQLQAPIVLAAGPHNLAVTAGTQRATATTNLADGCTAVVIAGQPGGPHQPLSIASIPECPIPRIPDREASVRALLATGSADGPVALTASDSPDTQIALPFAASARLDLPAGPAALTLTRPGRSGLLATLNVTLTAGDAYTVLVSGGSALLPVTEQVIVDGVQPPQAVPTGVRINTDGPAPRPRRQHLLPVAAALTATGAALTADAARRARHHRRRHRRPPRPQPHHLIRRLAALGLAALVGAGCHSRPAATATPPTAALPAAGVTPTSTPKSGPAGPFPPPSLKLNTIHGDVIAVPNSGLENLPALLPGNEIGWVDGSDPLDATAGTTALVGHVSYGGKPAVFADLALSRPGQIAELSVDGTTSDYRVDSFGWYPKGALPAWLWGPRPVPTLLLISCGGAIDPVTGLHELNVVVTAHLIGQAPRPA